MKTKLGVVFSVAVGLLIAAGSLWADHSYAVYDMTRLKIVKGTVTAHQFINSHQIIRMKERDDDGKVTQWILVGASVSANRAHGRAELDPLMHCYRPGLARIGPPLRVPASSVRVRFEGESVPPPGGPAEIDAIQIAYAPRKVWVIYQFNQEVRQIFTDGREHPEVIEDDLLSMWWNGHSVGSWDGDTLVVDTTNIRNETWLDDQGHEHRKLHIVDRFRRVDAETLEIERTLSDPIALAKSHKTYATLKLRPNLAFQENVVCDQYYERKIGFGFGGLLGINAHPWQMPEEAPNSTWEDVERVESEGQ